MSEAKNIVNIKNRSVDEIEEIFLTFDNRGDNKISKSLLGDVLRALGQNPTEAEVTKCGDHIKEDERISFDMFLPIYQAVDKNQSYTAEDFREGLQHFDMDGSGYISSADLRRILTTLGEKLTDQEVELLLNGHEDSKGNVDYADFIRFVMNGQ